MSRRLPSAPNLDHLKKQAKDVLRIARHRRPQWRLADAQHALARGYGFTTWPDLKLHVESITRGSGARPSVHREPSARTNNRSSHPIAGTWVTAGRLGDENEAPHASTTVVNFELMDEALVLTQIGSDGAGDDVAMKVTIHVDGVDHAVPFGDSVTLRASWIDGQTLETVASRGKQTTWRATYGVSPDGQSLVVSSAERIVRFERVQVE